MRTIFRRALCALLCLCMLLPGLALAEQDASGLRFRLGFQMDGSAFPREQQELMTSLADLVNILTLEGTLESSFTGCFDLNTQLMLNSREDTRTSLRVYGMESAWCINSSLLGQETLLVNLVALLEFSMKTYFRLDIPLQRLALLVSPYVHTSALDSMTSAWRRVMLAKEGRRTISRKQVRALAQEMADIAEKDSIFQYWVQALTLEAGYDEAVTQALAGLPAWVETFVNSNGIAVSFKGATETWRAGKTTLFTRTEEDAVTAWSLSLPPTANGYAITAHYTGQPSGEHLLQLNIADAAQATVLDVCLQATGVSDLENLELASPFTLQADVTGTAVKEETHLLLEGQKQDDYMTISLLDAKTRQPQLTVSGTVQAYTPQKPPAFTAAQMEDSFNLLSMNDTTLTQLLSRVASPLYHGLLPLLTHIPVSTMQSLLNLLEEHRVLDLMLNGGASGEAEYYD